MKKKKEICIIKGILRHGSRYGFTTCFKNKEQAQHYKEMFKIIIGSDNFIVETHKGYYDTKGD